MNRGIFVPIGGAESTNTLKQVIDLVGSRINLLLITSATSYKDEAEEKYTKIFGGMDCEVFTIHAVTRDELDTDMNLSKLDDADFVFFCGGDQSRISNCLLGTKFLTRMKKMVKNGLVISGTSAGASVMSSYMITGGKETPSIGAGISLVPDIIIDSHFEERNRMTRLQKAVDSMGGNRIGLGLSEDAAAIIRKNSIDIIGSGNVTLITSDGHKVLRPGDTFRI